MLLSFVCLVGLLRVALCAQPSSGADFGGRRKLTPWSTDRADAISNSPLPLVRREQQKLDSGGVSMRIDSDGDIHSENRLELTEMTRFQISRGKTAGRESREQALRDVVQALTAAGVEFVAGYGTALGLLREGQLVEQEDGVDFLVTEGTFDLVRPALQRIRGDLIWKNEEGMRQSFGPWNPLRRYFHRVSAPGWGPVQLYRVRPASLNRTQGAAVTRFLCEDVSEVLISIDELFPPKLLQPRGFPGLTVPMPNHAIEHLEHFYGDWHTIMQPKRDHEQYWSREAVEQYWRLCGPGRPAVLLFNHVLSVWLLIPLAGASWLAWKSSAANPSAVPERNSYVLGLAGSYCALSAGAKLVQRQSEGPTVLLTAEGCLLLYVLRVFLSLGLLGFKLEMSSRDIVNVLRRKDDNGRYVWCHFAVVGCLFASHDAMSFFGAREMPFLHVQLLLNSGLLVVPLQWCVLGKKTNRYQFLALLLIGVGASALGASDASAFVWDKAYNTQNNYFIGMFLIVGKCALSALALVANEKLLKESPLTVDAQNLIVYLFGMTFMGIGIACWAVYTCSTATLQEKIGLLFGQQAINPWIVTFVLLMAISGLVCAYFIKTYSALEKEVLSSGVVALLAVGQSLAPGEHRFGFQSIECAILIIIGCLAYRLNETALGDQVDKN